jgi:hypothetical protein
MGLRPIAVPAIKRKNPQGLVRGLSREIGIFNAFFGQKDESWFFWIFGIPVFQWYWISQK